MSRPFSRRSFLAATGAVAAGIKLAPWSALARDTGQLRLYNWTDYIAEDLLGDFEDGTGTAVQMDLYRGMDEMFARLQGENPGYDVIVPSDTYVDRMVRAGLLLSLDRSLLPNARNLDPAFMNAAFDPGRRHSMPYMWGTLGIGYRRSALDGEPDSWRWLFDSSEHAGRIALLDDPQLVIQMALKYLGHSINTIDARQIRSAAALIERQKPGIAGFDAAAQTMLLEGAVDLVLEWNGDILQVMEKDDDLAYVVPREGSLLWQDCLCIPRGAPHPEAAHRFIDFLLDAAVAARNAAHIRYATPNAAARELMPESYLQNTAIFPPPEVFQRCEIAWYRGEGVVELYQRLWREIRS